LGCRAEKEKAQEMEHQGVYFHWTHFGPPLKFGAMIEIWWMTNSTPYI